MYYVSVLIPMVVFSEKVNVISQISKQFNVPLSSIQFFELKSTIQKVEYVVKIPSLNINLSQINEMIQTNTKLKEQIAQLKQDIINIQQSLTFDNTFKHQRQMIFIRRQNQKLKQTITDYATNLSLIKNEASITIESIIASLRVQQATASTQTTS